VCHGEIGEFAPKKLLTPIAGFLTIVIIITKSGLWLNSRVVALHWNPDLQIFPERRDTKAAPEKEESVV
jgi:hypothetical protein